MKIKYRYLIPGVEEPVVSGFYRNFYATDSSSLSKVVVKHNLSLVKVSDITGIHPSLGITGLIK